MALFAASALLGISCSASPPANYACGNLSRIEAIKYEAYEFTFDGRYSGKLAAEATKNGVFAIGDRNGLETAIAGSRGNMRNYRMLIFSGNSDVSFEYKGRRAVVPGNIPAGTVEGALKDICEYLDNAGNSGSARL